MSRFYQSCCQPCAGVPDPCKDLAAELYRLTCCWLMHRYEEATFAKLPALFEGFFQSEVSSSYMYYVLCRLCFTETDTEVAPSSLLGFVVETLPRFESFQPLERRSFVLLVSWAAIA